MAILDETNPESLRIKTDARQMLENVHYSVSFLAQVLETFPGQVLATLKWIAKVFKLSRTTTGEMIILSITGDKSPVPSSVDSSSSSVQASSSPHHATSLPVKPAQPQEQSRKTEHSDAMDQDIDDDDALDFDEIVKQPKRGWADAASKWMKNLCLHVNALKSLTAFGARDGTEQRMTDYLTKVKLKIVGVAPEFRDTAMQSYDSFMNEFEEDQEIRQHIQEWLRRQDVMGNRAWNASKFNGTWHCETILLSLHALSVSSLLLICS